jgi:hypothetical protein
MANIYSLQSLAGASLLSLDDSGNLTVAGSVTSAGAATGITNLTATGNTALGDATTDTATITGTLTVSMPDNAATALDIKEASTSYLKLVTTNNAERITLGKRLGLPTQAAIAMADADVTLTTSTLTGQVLLASCTTGTHNLTMPSPTTYGGFLAFFYNTGSQSIVLKDDGAATMATVTAGSKAIITCNGTNWVAGLLS